MPAGVGACTAVSLPLRCSAITSPQALRWFWLLVRELSPEQQRRLLAFWTALPHLPAGGFSGLPQPLSLVRADPATQPLPQARSASFRVCCGVAFRLLLP